MHRAMRGAYPRKGRRNAGFEEWYWRSIFGLTTPQELDKGETYSRTDCGTFYRHQLPGRKCCSCGATLSIYNRMAACAPCLEGEREGVPDEVELEWLRWRMLQFGRKMSRMRMRVEGLGQRQDTTADSWVEEAHDDD